MNRATKLEILAVTVTAMAIYLSISTLDYQTAIEQENADLKVQIKKLRLQVSDPPKLCKEYYLQRMRKGAP